MCYVYVQLVWLLHGLQRALLGKKGGTTLDIRDVAASYSSIVRYSCTSTLLLGRQLL